MSVILGGTNGITYPSGSNTPASGVTTKFTPAITDTANVMTIKGGVKVIGSQGVFANSTLTTYQNGATSYTTAGTYSFVVPLGVTSLTYTVYGAGGGSGACNNNGDAWIGGGGGAGGKITGTLVVTPSETLTIITGLQGYGASTRFNSSYYYNPNNSTLGSGTAGAASFIKRSATTLVTATGGTGGVQFGYGVGGTPTVANTAPPGPSGVTTYNGDGEQGSTPGYKGYGYNGPILGGTNGSGTPPAGYGNAGTGYGNGGGQTAWNQPGTDGQPGAVIIGW